MNKVCSECEHIDTSKECHWGCPCAKTIERKKAFTEKNKDMDFMDSFRFSPSLWVMERQQACQFFEYNLKEIKRHGCGASDCTHNFQFRCTLPKINTDKTSNCLTFRQKL